MATGRTAVRWSRALPAPSSAMNSDWSTASAAQGTTPRKLPDQLRVGTKKASPKMSPVSAPMRPRASTVANAKRATPTGANHHRP